jgi:uncharacterized protein
VESKDQTTFQPIQKDAGFSFRCHPGIACFNRCCSKLNLTLTPYDIIRLKKWLEMDSSSFLDRYTRIFIDRQTGLPGVRLKMLENEERSCPFLTPEGCTVYQARPAACRLYPLGRATARPESSTDGLMEKFFLVKENHCLGFNEKRRWTPVEWMAHEGLDAYLAVNDPWQQTIADLPVVGPTDNGEKKKSMFFMASYNLDRFKVFLFKSSFFKRFDVDDATKIQIFQKDEDLLLFAIKWIRYSFIGEKSSLIKTSAPN